MGSAANAEHHEGSGEAEKAGGEEGGFVVAEAGADGAGGVGGDGGADLVRGEDPAEDDADAGFAEDVGGEGNRGGGRWRPSRVRRRR